jgi:hypothetical protein
MNVAFYEPFRACRLCLTFDDGCVFADFDVDTTDGRLYLVRISFDGYGCCNAPPGIDRLSRDDSEMLLTMASKRAVDPVAVAPILRQYFAANQQQLWADALHEYDLV